MKLCLLCVGKPREALTIALHDMYAQRIRSLGVDYTARSVPEVRPGGKYSDDHVRQREARLIEDALDGKQRVVAVERTGEAMSSEQLAARLERWAAPRVTFIVGGPLGLDPALLQRAEARWSLSALTFPHELVRVIVAEQLYRALTIRRGVPYHK